MLMPHQHPDVQAYRTAAIDLYEVERDIFNRRNSKSTIDAKIMPHLIEKRDRLRDKVEPLRAKAEAIEAAFVARQLRALEPAPPPAVTLATRNSGPLGDRDGLDIPEFLRRR